MLGNCTTREYSINLAELGVNAHDLSDLELPFTEEEVRRTIKQLPSDEAPGPDGFTGRFYKTCWAIIKEDIMAAISAVWSMQFGAGSLQILVCSILHISYSSPMLEWMNWIIGPNPSREAIWQELHGPYGPLSIYFNTQEGRGWAAQGFRPISLVHSFAKLITKMLANRLASRLQQMVSPSQSAFIKGHFIQDNFMLAQQTARFLNQQKQVRILLKLDISKAFDSVSWPFLLEILQQLGFGQVWRDIISGLLCSSSTQVLLNGIPGDHSSISVDCGMSRPGDVRTKQRITVTDDLRYWEEHWLLTKYCTECFLRCLSSTAWSPFVALPFHRGPMDGGPTC